MAADPRNRRGPIHRLRDHASIIRSRTSERLGRRHRFGGVHFAFRQSDHRERLLLLPDTWKIRFAPRSSVPTRTTRPSPTLRSKGRGRYVRCVASQEKGFVRASTQNLAAGVRRRQPLQRARNRVVRLQSAQRRLGPRRRRSQQRRAEGLTDIDGYLKAMADDAKLNIYRWSVNNCAFEMWSTIALTGNRYLVNEGQWGDFLVQKMREHGVRVYLDMFGWKPAFAGGANTRRGWTRSNATSTTSWRVTARRWTSGRSATKPLPPHSGSHSSPTTFKASTPYHHMVSSSWEHPSSRASVFVSPLVQERGRARFRHANGRNPGSAYAKKPINSANRETRSQTGIRCPSLRARIRSWTAFFNEGHLIFWESNFAKDYKSSAANLYIGPDL